MNTYIYNHTVDTHDVDFNKQLRFSQLQCLFQNAAAANSKQLGCGVDELARVNQAWILSRLYVEIDRLPRLGETVAVETWPLQPKRVEFIRNYTVNEDNRILIRATSRWCIIDITTGRLIGNDEIDYGDTVMRTDIPVDKAAGKLRFGELEWQYMYGVEVRPSMLDYNMHVNNARYADMISDCFSLERQTVLVPKTVHLDFLGQIRNGDKVDLYKFKEGDVRYIKGEVASKTMFLCKIHVTEKQS